MKIEKDYDLTFHNSYRIKATCSRAFFPACEEDIYEIFHKYSGSQKIVLGGGNNVIFSQERYDQDFVIVDDAFSSMKSLSNCIVEVDAGASTLALSQFALENELSGLEIFYDIPSSVGGAIVMNAGASGEEIKDILFKVRYFDTSDFSTKEISKEDIGFEYRNSFFQRHPNTIVLKAWLKLKKDNEATIREKMQRIKDARWAKQPKEYPNAGSVFKRPEGYFVGAMIDELNLKGFTIGGAKVSEKHGGFIVNFNNAKGCEIVELIQVIKNRVRERFNIDIEVEQRII